jgi:hypothetical protein
MNCSNNAETKEDIKDESQNNKIRVMIVNLVFLILIVSLSLSCLSLNYAIFVIIQM